VHNLLIKSFFTLETLFLRFQSRRTFQGTVFKRTIYFFMWRTF